MGAFTTSIAIITDEYNSVVSFLKSKKRISIITKPKNGIIYLYDEKCEQDYRQIKQLSKKITSEFKCLAIAFNNHDDDVLCYWIFDCGEEKDQYDSAPGYFKSGKIKAPKGGNPEVLCRLFNCNEGVEKLSDILTRKVTDEKPYHFEHERHQDICNLLGIDFHLSALSFKMADMGEEGEISEVEMIGDTPAAQFNRKLRKAEDEKEILKSSGTLIEELIDKRQSYSQPVWTFCVKTGRLYFCYSHHDQKEDNNLLYIEPGDTCVKEVEYIKITSTIYKLAIDESGKYLAAGHASGNWTADIFELENGKLVSTLQNKTLTNSILFNKTSTKLYCLSDSLSCVSVPDMEIIHKKSDFKTFPTCMGLHPSGDYIVLGCQNHVDILDLKTFHTHSRLLIGKIQDLDADPYTEYMSTLRYITAGLGDVKDTYFKMMRSNTSRPFAFEFTPDGKQLFMAGSKGLWIYDWDDFLMKDTDTPDPINVYTFLEVMKDEIREYDPVAKLSIIQWHNAYDACYDAENKLILYSNINGMVCYVDMNKKEHGKLYEAPGNPAIIKMVLSPDKKRLVCSINYLNVNAREIPGSTQILHYQDLLKKAGIINESTAH